MKRNPNIKIVAVSFIKEHDTDIFEDMEPGKQYFGLRAKVMYDINIGPKTAPHLIRQSICSSGVWGIEEPAPKQHLQNRAREEAHQLEEVLKELRIDTAPLKKLVERELEFLE